MPAGYPLDIERKLNVNKMPRTSSERLMYVHFTFCALESTYIIPQTFANISEK